MCRFASAVGERFVLAPLVCQANHVCLGSTSDQGKSCQSTWKQTFPPVGRSFCFGKELGRFQRRVTCPLLQKGVCWQSEGVSKELGMCTQVHLWTRLWDHYTLAFVLWGALPQNHKSRSQCDIGKVLPFLIFWMKYTNNCLKRILPFIQGLQPLPLQRMLP